MIDSLPIELPVKALDRQHEEYAATSKAWEDIDYLYRGGHQIKAVAGRFLHKRPKEVASVYQSRLERFTYQNIIGSVFGWYQSALFECAPEVVVKHGEKIVEDGGDYFSRLLADCTRNGKSFVDLWRDVFLDLMLFRRSYVLTDLPAQAGEFGHLESQKASGALDAYLLRFSQRDVINWERDDNGVLEWILIAATFVRHSIDREPLIIDRWYAYDRTGYAVYEAARDGSNKASVARQVDKGLHALSAVGRVPVRVIEAPEALWLGDRAYLQACDHLNHDNAYAWALFMSNLPVPVIKGEFKGDVKLSETSYIQLATDGDFGFAEPSGVSFQVSAERVASLREEIYRGMYLQAQARSNDATPAAQSGISKQADMAPSKNVLSGFGDIIRAGMAAVLGDVADARGEQGITFSVQGFDFEEDASLEEVEKVAKIRDAGIESGTLEKQQKKRAARAILPDEREEIMRKIDQEIDAAPTATERAEAESKAQADAMKNSLNRMAKVAA